MKAFPICIILFCILVPKVTGDRILPSIGASLELTGQIFVSSNVVSVPAVLSMGWVRNLFLAPNISSPNNTCESRMFNIHRLLSQQLISSLKANLGTLLNRKEVKSYQEALCTVEPELCLTHGGTKGTDTKSRPRRFLFTTGVALGAGLGSFGYWLYDKIAGNSANEAIGVLKTNQNIIRRNIQRQGTAIIALEDSIHQIWSVAVKNQQELANLRNQISCDEDSIETLMRYIPVVAMIPNQFHRAINDVLAGRVTPDLIAYDQLKFLLSKTRSLEETLYHMDGSLFYQFARSTPVEVNIEDDILTFVIQVPKITMASVGVTFSVHNFGLHMKDEIRRIRLPDYVARFRLDEQEHIYASVSKDRCETTPGVWLCGPHALDYTSNPMCLSGVFEGNSSACQWEGRREPKDPEVLVTKSFVFVHTCTHLTTFFNFTQGGKRSIAVPPRCNETKWYSLSAFDLLIVATYHIEGHRTTSQPPVIVSGEIKDLTNDSIHFSPLGSLWRSPNEINDTIEHNLANAKQLIEESIRLNTFQTESPMINYVVLGCAIFALSISFLIIIKWIRDRRIKTRSTNNMVKELTASLRKIQDNSIQEHA